MGASCSSANKANEQANAPQEPPPAYDAHALPAPRGTWRSSPREAEPPKPSSNRIKSPGKRRSTQAINDVQELEDCSPPAQRGGSQVWAKSFDTRTTMPGLPPPPDKGCAPHHHAHPMSSFARVCADPPHPHPPFFLPRVVVCACAPVGRAGFWQVLVKPRPRDLVCLHAT